MWDSSGFTYKQQSSAYANFWMYGSSRDMYDYWNDGTNTASTCDSLLFTDPAESVALYLGNSRNAIPDYLGLIKSLIIRAWLPSAPRVPAWPCCAR